jgi:hypothetical protein
MWYADAMPTAPVICSECSAAYDLHDYPPGYRFRCACGAPVVRPGEAGEAGARSGEAGEAGSPEAAPSPRPALPPHLRPGGGAGSALPPHLQPGGGAGPAPTATGSGPGGCADPGPSPRVVRAFVLACLFFLPAVPAVGTVLGALAARDARRRGDETDRKVAVAAVVTGLCSTAAFTATLMLLVWPA